MTAALAFDDLVQALTRYLFFESWEHLLDFMLQGLEISVAPDSARISK